MCAPLHTYGRHVRSHSTTFSAVASSSVALRHALAHDQNKVSDNFALHLFSLECLREYIAGILECSPRSRKLLAKCQEMELGK